MIEDFDIAPTSASICRNCGKIIKKGEARGIKKYNYRGFISQRYYCLKCSKKQIRQLLY